MRLAAVACVLLAALPAAAAAPHWEAFVEPYATIFPSLEIATATMPADPAASDPSVIGDQDGLIGIEIEDAPAGAAFELTVRVPGLARDSRLRGELPDGGGPVTLLPTIAWDYPALAAIRQPRPALVEFELAVDGRELGSKSERVRVRSLNDALYYIDEDDGQQDLDFNWLFAAYVNEDHAAVDTILQQALATGAVDGFTGYQGRDPDAVLQQVFAIWHALRERGIRYSSITRTGSAHPRVLSQHVRFIDESLAMTQANCVDGSVLLASVLRKIEIDPVLVLTPGHMLLGFALDPDGREMAYLETTRIGAVTPKGRDAKGAIEASLANFEAAIQEGQRQVDAAGAAFNDPTDGRYQIIDIKAARERGVMPIGR